MNLPQAAMNWGAASESFLASQFPLHRACRDGDIETLNSLLDAGEQDLYVEDDFYGWTPMHWCSYFGKLACLRRLINHLERSGVKVCDLISSRFSQTPSHLCGYAGHPQCLYWLIKAHCNFNIQDYMGETPAHKAARTGSMECLSLLVSQGANLSVRNQAGNTASQVAAASGYAECGHYLERAAQIQAHASDVYDEMRVPVTRPHCNGVNPISIPLQTKTSTQQERGDSQAMAQTFVSINTYHSNPHVASSGSLAHNNNNNNSVEAESCDMEMEEEERGHGVVPWMVNTCEVPNGDVLLDQGVSHNIVPLAGKKRGREEVEEEIFKRARNDDYTFEYSNRKVFSELPFDNGMDINDNGTLTDEPSHMTNGQQKVTDTEVKVNNPMLSAAHHRIHVEPVASCLRFKDPQIRCLNFMSHYI